MRVQVTRVTYGHKCNFNEFLVVTQKRTGKAHVNILTMRKQVVLLVSLQKHKKVNGARIIAHSTTAHDYR